MKINKIKLRQFIAKFITQVFTQFSIQLTAFGVATFCAFTLFAFPAMSSIVNSAPTPLVSATDFIKDTHYTELTIPINDNIEVREFFSFYCPGCYRHEPIMLELKAAFTTKLLTDIPLIKNHIDGMPGRDVSVEEMLSKALLTAKLLNIEEKIVEQIFQAIHVNKEKFTQEQEIKTLFLLHDIDEQRFDKTFNSFSVKTGVSKMKKATEVLREQGITSVPTVIVNGKYKVETKAITSKEQYIDLVLYLLNR